MADSLLGSLLLRSQGRAVWRRFNDALQAGRMPHREVQHGVAVIFGGALLLTPGFLTDILGLALLLPPTRAVIVRLAQRIAARRMARAAGRARAPAPARLRRGGHRLGAPAAAHGPAPARPVSEPALSIAFFDPEHGLHGSARSGTTLLFEGSSANVLPDGPEPSSATAMRGAPSWRAPSR